MTKRNEISIYNQSQVQSDGEIPEWDDVIFPQIIRKKIIEKVTFIIEYQKPNLTLDYGCGGGWISNLISNKGFDVVGFDISHGIISKARESTKGNFLVCDAEYLPFKQRSFDLIIGISVLHHLNNLQKGIYEIYMILRDKGHLFFEEPNLLNPFSAFGRRFFPMETHTENEKPLNGIYTKYLFQKHNIICDKIIYLYFISFPLSRFLRLAKIRFPSFLIKPYNYLELFFEGLPIIKNTNASFIINGNKLE